MIQELSGPNKVVGAKQAKRALRDGRAVRLFMAMDADPRLLQPLVQEAVNRQVPVSQVSTMKELGAACGIAVGAAVAVLTKEG
ncbi:MAG: 50S ribosomal protein L7ae-like protein [Lawsonibacter sp.]|jgi:large subunit ribosomal protein L7A|nr:50S ribosomal protein L7ae-like protein [Lawsonibacter sp.]